MAMLTSFFPPQADGVFLVSSLRAVSPTGWKQETKKKLFLKILLILSNYNFFKIESIPLPRII